ncbi:MAG: zf-HC2 domain-containing protein, partial [Candidatus Didemnitutus sp.]|nr:zf-HC2 domain-containing protein [Candidatus Didemnitutus sp.]
MNCRATAPLLSAERDGALTPSQRSELARHLADCAGCRQLQAELAQAMTAFQTEAAHVSTPDPEEEWRLLQAQ